MTRGEAINWIINLTADIGKVEHRDLWHYEQALEEIRDMIEAMPLEQPEWIPCSERMPDDLEVVNITWINHKPEPYYHDIEDKSFVASGVHYRGKWYWYSTTCADYLGEYGSNEVDLVDDAIEITAWMPLPESYKGGEQNG